MNVWGIEAICEGWFIFFSTLSKLLEDIERNNTIYLNDSKLSYYILELEARLSSLITLSSFVKSQPSTISEDTNVQMVAVYIEKIIEHISHHLLPFLRSKEEDHSMPLSSIVPAPFQKCCDEEQICHLRSIGFTWASIADIFGISRMTI
jgi:hypothetical protein